MSQLPDASRQAWYSELQRLARPGALVLLSVRGDTAIAKSAMDPHSVELIDEHGSLFVPSGTTMNGQPTRGTTFQRTAAAASEAAQWFDVLEVVPAGINNHQDLLVLRRGGHAE
jgi:hypothetical protein